MIRFILMIPEQSQSSSLLAPLSLVSALGSATVSVGASSISDSKN